MQKLLHKVPLPISFCFANSFKAAVASVASPFSKPKAHKAKIPCWLQDLPWELNE